MVGGMRRSFSPSWTVAFLPEGGHLVIDEQLTTIRVQINSCNHGLADFSKTVHGFERYGVFFVSVTQ